MHLCYWTLNVQPCDLHDNNRKIRGEQNGTVQKQSFCLLLKLNKNQIVQNIRKQDVNCFFFQDVNCNVQGNYQNNFLKRKKKPVRELYVIPKKVFNTK